MPLRIDPFTPATTALIVVDMQNDFVDAGAAMHPPGGLEILPTLRRAIEHARQTGMRVIYTAHVHRAGQPDKGRFLEISESIATEAILVDGTLGADIHPAIAPAPGELVIKKHRYSAFFGTDLDIILRGAGIDTVVITGVTTENCCQSTARDALFRDYRVAFLSDATGTFAYPDVGQGALSAVEVHRSVLVILANSTADVMTTETFIARTRAAVAAA